MLPTLFLFFLISEFFDCRLRREGKKNCSTGTAIKTQTVDANHKNLSLGLVKRALTLQLLLISIQI